MKSQKTFDITSLDQLANVCRQLIQQIQSGDWVFLVGDLGTGKTAFSQCFIRQLGYKGIVSSPTYAIMNTYETKKYLVVHSDLYRLGEPEELYEIGLTDYQSNTVHLIEWPEKGQGALSNPNWVLQFDLSKVKRTLIVTKY